MIDFAMRHQGFRSVKETLAWLDGMFKGRVLAKQQGRVGERMDVSEPSLFSFQQQGGAAAPDVPDSRQLEFIDAKPITNPAILDYLTKERHLPAELVKHYLKEVTYRNIANDKVFFAFGIENESGGYEIRVASSKYSFKSALKARDITLIHGTTPERGIVNVFEGMTDFLSLLVMMNFDNLAGDTLIMHSLSSFPRTAEFLRGRDYQTINTFLDNDRPGQEGTAKFVAEFGAKVTSKSEMFTPYSDLNDALCANLPTINNSLNKEVNNYLNKGFNHGRAK